MTLPIDISTSLWFNNVPIWEWEPVQAPGSEDPSTSPAASDSTPESSTDEASAAQSSTASFASVPAPAPGETRPGYKLVFKGFKVAATVFWFPADGPMSRPWLHDPTREEDPRRAHEPKARHMPDLDAPTTPDDAPSGAD